LRQQALRYAGSVFSFLVYRLLQLCDRRVQPVSAAAELDWYVTVDLELRSQRELCSEAIQRSRHDLEAIWLDYLAHGGGADFVEFDAYFHNGLVMPQFERRVLDQTLWELRHFAD
jgi:hypothetical protein